LFKGNFFLLCEFAPFVFFVCLELTLYLTIMSQTEDKNKRPSTYWNPVCTFCKLRHPAPNNENCVMAVIARAEEIPDEVPPTQMPAAMAPNTLSGVGGQSAPLEARNTEGTDEVFDGDQAEGGGDLAPEDDTGYSHVALMMTNFLQTVCKDMRGMRKEVAQLRQEVRSVPAPLAEIRSPDPLVHVVPTEVHVAAAHLLMPTHLFHVWQP
jgi:hypothetical protein